MEQLTTIRPGADKELVLNTLLSSFDDGVWLWNLKQGKFDITSPAARAIFGSALEFFNQDPEKWVHLIHPEDRDRVLHECTHNLLANEEIDIEYRILRENGETRIIRDHRKLISKDTNTGPTLVYGVVQDITQQKRDEHQLEEDDRSYQLMFMDHPNPMWLVNGEDGRILEVNNAAIESYGYTKQEFRNMKFADLDVKESSAPEVATKQKSSISAIHQKKNGEKVNVLITTADYVYNGKPAKLLLAIDITKKLEDGKIIRDLNKRLADFKYALTNSSIVSMTDAKGIINYVNDNFLKISGYGREELIGSNHNIINSGYHSSGFFKEMWKIITKGKIWRGDIRNRAKDGSYYWVDTYIVPLLDDQGKPYQYISIRNDITGRKNTEEELAELNRQLEERVKKRTQALELANTSLQDFAYSISHDLRAPVRHIRNFAQIVLDENKERITEEAVKYQGYVIQATSRLSQQIEGLLEFSRVGCKLINYKLVDTGAMVQQVINQAIQHHNGPPCHFHVDELPDVKADDILLEQVFANLISNALKYSSKQPECQVWIKHWDNDGHHQFMVKDNGVGFDMAYSSKLFGMFSRLHSQSEFEGNGIGLVNVKRIVERHEGKVWVESELGKGAAFYFTLSKNLENERQS